MDSSLQITLLMVMAVAAGITAQVLAELLKVPSIIFLLTFGIALGPDGLDLLHPHLLDQGLDVLVSLSVALILFEGGLSLELRELGEVSGSLRNLVTLGTLITLVGGGMAAHWLGEFPWAIAFLYAALVVVTGPTVIGPMLRQVNVDRQVATLLEGEGVLIDPVGAILAVVVLDVIRNGDTDPLRVISGLLLRLSVGAGIGAGGGWLLGQFLKRATFLSDELKNLVSLAGLWSLFGLAQTIRSEAGLMTAVMAGIVLRTASVPEERLLRRFKSQLTILAISVLFILLSADLSLASMVALGWGGPLTVVTLMWVVRPLNVWVCTWNSGLNWQQKFFLSWISPRGIVSASVASLFSILLTESGINGGDSIKALVFLTIILTVFMQGLTASSVAQGLGIATTQVRGVVIVGATPLGRLIARLFQGFGESAVLIDTDATACQVAQEDGLQVFQSSAMDTVVLETVGLSGIGTFLALTNNGEVNLVLAQRAAEEFNPPRVLASFPRDPAATATTTKSNTKPNNSAKVRQAFLPELSLKHWNQYLADKQVRLGETVLRNIGFSFQQAHLQTLIYAQELLPLLVERDGQLQVVAANEDWLVGDRLIYLLHSPQPELLRRLSGSRGFRLTPERLPEVEDIPIPPPAVEAIAKEMEQGQ